MGEMSVGQMTLVELTLYPKKNIIIMISVS